MDSRHSAFRLPLSAFHSWWPSLVAGTLALALYARTLAPGLTWAHAGSDGGDLLAAALTAGVPHPPGYPTYQLLLRALLTLFPGKPDLAGNWLSAACAALAVALLAGLARSILPKTPWRGAVASITGLTWAASPTLWSQAVITEVYALNALIFVGLLCLAWRWCKTVQDGRSGVIWVTSASLLWGLGLGNHLSLVLLVPGMLAWLWANRAGLRRAPWWGWIAAFVAGLAGLSVYACLPLAASGNPPVNWGDPQTLPQLWWVVSGRAYRWLPFGVELAYLPGRLAAWVADALRQFGGPWGALIALAGLWRIDRDNHAWWRLTVLTALAYSIYAIGYNAADSYVYLIPVWAVAALWLAAGVNWGVQMADGRWQMANRRWQMANRKSQIADRRSPDAVDHARYAIRDTQFAIRCLLFAVLLLLTGVSLIRFWGEMDLSRDHEARDYVAAVLAEAAPDSVILTAGDGPTFALWYARYGLGQRPDLTPVNVNLYAYPWYRKTLESVHPSLVEAAGGDGLPLLDQLAVQVAMRRPLYRGEPLNVVLPGLSERPVGVLVRLEVDKRSVDK